MTVQRTACGGGSMKALRLHVFGAVYGDPVEPSYITTEGMAVWMWRKGQRVRFLAADGDR